MNLNDKINRSRSGLDELKAQSTLSLEGRSEPPTDPARHARRCVICHHPERVVTRSSGVVPRHPGETPARPASPVYPASPEPRREPRRASAQSRREAIGAQSPHVFPRRGRGRHASYKIAACNAGLLACPETTALAE